MLLDIGLPDIDGFEVIRQIRAFSDVPVVMLTARDDAMDKVKGLELGADDYVTKPFNHLELMARVKAVLRRLEMPAPTSRAPSFRSGDLEVDFAAQEARLRGVRLDLTPTEYKLLYHLVRNAGHVLQHGTLLAKVWGREYVDEVDYIRVYIRRLRDKLGDDPTPRATSRPSVASATGSSRPPRAPPTTTQLGASTTDSAIISVTTPAWVAYASSEAAPLVHSDSVPADWTSM